MNCEVYTKVNYPTKKALVAAVVAGDVPVFNTEGGAGIIPVVEGQGCVCMPHYPQPHKSYATVTIAERNGEFYIPQGSKVK